MRAPRSLLAVLLLVFGPVAVSPARAGWSTDPVVISPVSAAFPHITACEDGAHGAFVAWQQEASGEVRAHHLLATGDLDPGWPVDGVMISDVVVARPALHLLADGMGGAFVWWMEGASFYIKRIGPDGATVSGWPERGRLVTTFTDDDRRPDVIGDGAGGAYAAWTGVSLGGSDPVAAYVMHLGPNNESGGGYGSMRNVSGADAVWTNDEFPQLSLASDGGVFVGWARMSTDPQQVSSSWRLARLTPAGLPAPGWPFGGIEVRPLQYIETAMRWARLDMHPDGAGGLIYFLVDQVAPGNFGYDGRIYRLLEDGSPAPDWPASGAPLAGGYCQLDVGPDGGIRVFPGGAANVLVGVPMFSVHWADYMAASVAVNGGVPAIQVGVNVPGVEMVASGSGTFYSAALKPSGPYGPYEPCAFLAFRQIPAPPGWSGVEEFHCEPVLAWYGDVAIAPTGDGGAIFFWSQRREIFGLFAKRFGAAGQVVGVDPAPALNAGLERVWFAPGAGIRASGSTAGTNSATLQVFDVGGRQIATRTLAGRGPFETTIEGTALLPAGIYLARLIDGNRAVTVRVAVFR